MIPVSWSSNPYVVLSHTVWGLVCVTIEYDISEDISFQRLDTKDYCFHLWWSLCLGSLTSREASCYAKQPYGEAQACMVRNWGQPKPQEWFWTWILQLQISFEKLQPCQLICNLIKKKSPEPNQSSKLFPDSWPSETDNREHYNKERCLIHTKHAIKY